MNTLSKWKQAHHSIHFSFAVAALYELLPLKVHSYDGGISYQFLIVRFLVSERPSISTTQGRSPRYESG